MFLAGILLLVDFSLALDNGAALTPSMGWSTWNRLKCNFTDKDLLEVAAAMKESGMLAAGYTSLNIDDCWPLKKRAADGSIVPDPQKFPNGMQAFSEQMTAASGVALGIYTAHGNKTCQGYPGSLGHEAQDVALYAKWHVVYVKNDWCWRDHKVVADHLDAFNAMRDALNATGKPMVHSIHWNYNDVPGPGCAPDVDCPLPQTANMWRIGGDVGPQWGSVLRLIDTDAYHFPNATAGAWNDADMLEVGNGMTKAQDQAHFSMWCILCSPLIAGNDVRTMSAETAAILTNTHAIGVNQDPLGEQGRLVWSGSHGNGNGTAATQIWAKPLGAGPAGAVAVVLLNRGAADATITLDFSVLRGLRGLTAPASRTKYTVFDLWQGGASLGVHTGSVAAPLGGTAAAMYRLEPVSA